MIDLKKGVALALGAGAARGMAHIGVLSVLESHHIPIQFFSGASIGALVAVCYAAKPNADYWRKRFLQLKKKDFLPIKWGNLLKLCAFQKGFCSPSGILRFLEQEVPFTRLEELAIPIRIAVTKFPSGIGHIFERGDLRSIVLASMSLPPFFNSVSYEGSAYIDGGFSQAVPVPALYNVPWPIIAVDIGTVPIYNTKKPLRSFFNSGLILYQNLCQFQSEKASFVLKPALEKYSFLETKALSEVYQAGVIEASEKLGLQKDLDDKAKSL